MFYDFADYSAVNFQDPASPIAEALADLHHTIFSILLVIATVVIYLLCELLRKWYYNWEEPTVETVEVTSRYLQTVNLIHSSTLETVWTIIPSLILMVIAVPSFALLYAMDEVLEPWITIKCIGHQWYWSYEYGCIGNNPENPFINVSNGAPVEVPMYDSYMVPTTELKLGENRLLEVDNPIYLPANRQIRFIVTATDVLHAFSVNSLGIKVDAVPGRLNQVMALINREGTFYGQCSELCGTNHAFMPIVVEGLRQEKFYELAQYMAMGVLPDRSFAHC
jgi:cytochrome c oxidase subunit 2